MLSTTMPKKRGPGRPRQHGGRRANQTGRPRLEGVGLVPVMARLLPRQIAKVERWQEANGAENFAEALRQMIDAMPEV